MFRRLLSICFLCLCSLTGWAQELNCRVTVMHDKITGSGIDPQVFSNMQKAIMEFLNGHKWTTDEFAASEKIDCNILINLTANNVSGDPEAYSATMSIQATRPVYNSAYTSKLLDYIDKDVSFKFSPFNPMHFDDNQASGTDALSGNLTAILAYYSYLVLALDYDSFAPNGGSNYLKKAQNVVNNAPDGKGITGWKNVESTHNRYWIVDQMLNTRFSDIRKVWYSMHREGLDSMYSKPAEARNRILSNLRKLYEVNRENPSSVYLQFFFNAKSDEIMHLLGQAPKNERTQYITLLNTMDVPNAPKYNALR